MTKITTRLALLGCCAVAAISAPVVANHGHLQPLRGSFASQSHGNAHYVAPQSWQEKRLSARLIDSLRARGPGTYEVTETLHPAELHHGDSHAGHHYHGQVAYVGTPAPQHANAPGTYLRLGNAPRATGLRGFTSPRSLRYSALDGDTYYNDRSIELGGLNVRTSAKNSRDMLDWQENTTGKALNLLVNRADGVLAPNSLYVGGGFKGGLMYQKTSVDGQFPLLSRFPFFSNRTDDEAAVFAINNAALAFTSTYGDWTTVYLQPEYSETEYGRDQDEFQLRKAFVVLGNLEQTPFYAAFGRKTIDFGNFDSYNAFTHNEGAHYFHAVSDQPVLELGLYNKGWKLSATAMSGGRQLRVAFADEENNIANYAASIEKEFLLPNFSGFTVGGGYLHDTIYRDNFTAHTFQGRVDGTAPANFIEYRNSVVNGFAEYTSPFFDAMVEYTTTLEPWAAAIPQSVDGTPLPQYLIDPAGSTTSLDNINFDEKLSVLVAQARIKPMVNGRRMAISAVGSWGNISDDFGNVGVRGQRTTFEKNQQHVLSVEYPISDYMEFGAEYVYNKGFIPFVAPQQVSNDQTEAHAINIGFKARF